MGFFDRILEHRKKKIVQKTTSEYFDLLSGYKPVFSGFSGGVYEMSQTRAAIHANANHRSKLQIDIVGDTYKDLAAILKNKPNPYQTTSQFLYKISTILDCENTCILIPLYDANYPDNIVGIYPVHASSASLVNHDGVLYLQYIQQRKKKAIEYDRCGILTKMSYNNEIFGDANTALKPTMDLAQIHTQSITEAVKSSATIRFLVRLSNTFREDDINKARDRFISDNLTSKSGGVLIADNKFADIKQLDSKPIIVDDKQMALIDNNVHDYFGVNRKILQNTYNSAEWSAYYEGNIETFAIQLSQVLTSMLFTHDDIARGCMVYLSANRLQYASNEEKINIVSTLFDRGLLTTNQGLDIFCLPPVEDGGDKRYIRKDYIDSSLLGAEIDLNLVKGGDD